MNRLTFNGPFPQSAELSIELPPKFADDSGRALVNASSFPLKTRTGEGPPMHDVSGVSGAAPIWRDVMQHLHRRGARPSVAPAMPPGVVAQAMRYQPAIEPPRIELFIAGSERKVFALAAQGGGATALAQARIASPTPGSIIALDPDIPLLNQRLRFQATLPIQARWEIDGKAMDLADASAGWFPQPGTHRLALRSDSGELLDEAEFEVRGAKMKAAARR